MALLDRLRRRPRWEDPDPKVRADAVREIPAAEQDRLVQIATDDPDPQVRRAAVRRLSSVDVLARLAAGDADPGVREKAASALVALALGADEAVALAAAESLTEARHLTTVALTAALASARMSGLARLSDARALARIARSASDPAIRLKAVASLTAPAELVDVGARSEHKDAAVAAVERIDDLDSLRTIAARARHKAAARRARERVAALAPPESTSAGEAAGEVAGEVPGRAQGPDEAPDADVAASSAHEDATLPPADAVTEVDAGPPAAPPAEPVAESPGELSAEPSAEPPADAPADPRAGAAHEMASVAGDGESNPSVEAPPGPGGEPGESGGPREADGGAILASSLAPRLRTDRRQRIAQAEALCARLSELVAAKPFVLRDADVALRDARLPHDDLAALPPKLARHLREVRAALFARAQEAREAEEWGRWSNAAVQEELCRRMEALVAEDDLEKAARELRTLDGRWAEVKIAPRDEAGTLRQRYQTARAPLKERLDAYFAEKAAREAENLRLKQELCARAEALADSTEWLKASEELKALQSRWKEVGPAPHKAAEAVWRRFRAACDRFFTRRQDDLKKRKHEWAANIARKQGLCERAEALAESSEWEATAAEIRKLQAEWKTVGPVRRDRSEAIWQRFRKACDAFFERYKHRDEVERQARLEQREKVCRELETLVAGAGAEPAPPKLVEEIQRILALARQGPPVAPAEEEVLAARLSAARDRAVAGWPDAFRGTDLDPEAGRVRREKLLARVEALLAREPPASALSGEDLARRLKEALATNTMGGRGEVEARRRAEVDEVKGAQAAWRKLPPMAGEAGQALEHRFRSACDRFFRERVPAAAASRGR